MMEKARNTAVELERELVGLKLRVEDEEEESEEEDMVSSGIIATRNSNQKKFNLFVEKLRDFTYNAGWRVDKHARYMVDIRKTGRANIIGFGDAGVFLSKDEPNPQGDGFIFTTPSIILNDLCYDKG